MNCIITILVLIALGLLINIPLAYWERQQRKRKIEKAFVERQELNEREFYERYFQQLGIPFFVVAAVREAFEFELKTDMSRLRPEDKYSDLNFNWVDDLRDYSLEYSEILDFLEEKLQIQISEKEREQIETVNEIVSLAWQKFKKLNQRDD